MHYRSLPDFLIIGAQKAGTTVLYSYLSQHPKILRPAFKEAHFFDVDDRFHQGLSKYALNFPLPYQKTSGSLNFEATPDYLYYTKCAERIHKDLGDIPIIIVLREPVSRAFSAWKMHHYHFRGHERHSKLYDPRSFAEAVAEEQRHLNNQQDHHSYLSRGLYAGQIEEYLKFWPKDKLLIIDNMQLKRLTQQVIDEVCDFLEIPRFNIDTVDRSEMFWENKSSTDEKIDSELQKYLTGFFEQPNTFLEELTERKFSW